MRFEDALRAAGLRPREIIADGRIRRCPTDAKPGRRNGWYCLHADGHGTYGDWTSGGGEALGHWRDEHAQVDAAALARAQERSAAQREQERRQRVQAMRSARQFWHEARPTSRLHPYLERKGLSPLGTAGLREHLGALIVPVWHGGWIISVQSIWPDGAKRFWPGAPVKGGAFVLERRGAAVTVLCEGLSTGLAIFQCVRQARVIVAFDAGNLLHAAQTIKPRGSVVIAADNDWKTKAKRGFNPGMDKAANVADLIGCGVAYPQGIEGSDYCDMLMELGSGAARKIERQILSQARYVTAPEGATHGDFR
jgi:putative DNA primase/helicase